MFLGTLRQGWCNQGRQHHGHCLRPQTRDNCICSVFTCQGKSSASFKIICLYILHTNPPYPHILKCESFLANSSYCYMGIKIAIWLRLRSAFQPCSVQMSKCSQHFSAHVQHFCGQVREVGAAAVPWNFHYFCKFKQHAADD